MVSVPEVATAIQRMLTTVAETAAQTSGFVQRRSKLTGPRFVQTLVLGWWQAPQASLSELAQTAASLGVPITPQGLDQRFTEAAATCVREVLEVAVTEVIAADPVAIPVLERFTAVVVQDSSTVTFPEELATVWRGCGGRTGQGTAALKLHVRLNLNNGRLTGPRLTDARVSDRASPLREAPLPAGALRLADLGFFSLDDLATATDQELYWLSRLQVQTAVFLPDGARLDLPRWLAAGPAVVDQPVELGVSHHLPARLLAIRVPRHVGAERRRKLRAEARRKGQAVSQARLAVADWTILVTNVPATLLTVAEALVLLRARWQIELLFKLWKQHAHLDEWRSQQPWRILCEVYAKLLVVRFQHWCILLACWAFPDRSLVKAVQALRGYAVLLASAVSGVIALTTALEQMQRCLLAGCRMNPRRKAPNTYQLLLAFPARPDAPAGLEVPDAA